MDEKLRLRLRLIYLLNILYFRRRCMEVVVESGMDIVIQAIKRKPIDYNKVLLAGVTTLLAIKVPEIMVKVGK